MDPVFETICNIPYVLPTNFKNYLGSDFSKSFKCIHINAQSIRNKEMQLNVFLQNIDVITDIVMITETWSTNETDVCRLPGYQTYFLNRASGRGGGVCMLFHKQYLSELIPDYTVSTNDYEIWSVCLESCLYVVCYRPPSGCIEKFFDMFESLIHFTQDHQLKLTFGGDVNINMLNTDLTVKKFDFLLKANGLCNVIQRPTRITAHTSTLLDLFITNTNRSLKAGIFLSDFSDHLPIFLCLTKMHSKRKSSSHIVQSITEQNILEFRNVLQKINWSDVLNEKDPNRAYECFLDTFISTYNTSFPEKLIKHKRRARKPYITHALLIKVNEKNRLYHHFIKTKDLNDLKVFKTFRNRLNKDLQKARRDYYNKQFACTKGRADMMWKKLNHLIAHKDCPELSSIKIGGVEISEQALANKFNEYFVNLSSILRTSNDLSGIKPVEETIFLIQ